MALKFDSIIGPMLKAAATAGASLWEQVKTIAVTQVRVMAHQVVEIGEGLRNGEFGLSTAKILLRGVKRNIIGTLAEMTVLVFAAAQKIINAALDAVKTAVNTAVGLPFLA